MKRYAILLHNGHLVDLGPVSYPKARRHLGRWKDARRKALAAGEIVWPRMALGLVCFEKPRHRGAFRLGQLGGKARAEKLSPERRREIAQTAARKRWSAAA